MKRKHIYLSGRKGAYSSVKSCSLIKEVIPRRCNCWLFSVLKFTLTIVHEFCHHQLFLSGVVFHFDFEHNLTEIVPLTALR